MTIIFGMHGESTGGLEVPAQRKCGELLFATLPAKLNFHARLVTSVESLIFVILIFYDVLSIYKTVC